MDKTQFDSLIDAGKFNSALSAVSDSTSEDLKYLQALATHFGDAGFPNEEYHRIMISANVEKIKNSTSLTNSLSTNDTGTTETSSDTGGTDTGA